MITTTIDGSSNNKLLLCLISSAVLIMAASGKVSANDRASTAADRASKASSMKVMNPSSSDLNRYLGTWTSACSAGPSYSIRVHQIFENAVNSTVRRTVQVDFYYGSKDCTGTVKAMHSKQGTYTYAGKVNDASDDRGNKTVADKLIETVTGDALYVAFKDNSSQLMVYAFPEFSKDDVYIKNQQESALRTESTDLRLSALR